MWSWLIHLDPLVLAGVGCALLGLLVTGGAWAVRAAFREEYAAPPAAGSMPARLASGEYPVVALRTLAQDWRDQVEAPPVSMMPRNMPAPRVGRHRWDWVGQNTQALSLDELGKELGRGQNSRYHPRPRGGVRSAEARGYEQAEGGQDRQRRQDARWPQSHGEEGGAHS